MNKLAVLASTMGIVSGCAAAAGVADGAPNGADPEGAPAESSPGSLRLVPIGRTINLPPLIVRDPGLAKLPPGIEVIEPEPGGTDPVEPPADPVEPPADPVEPPADPLPPAVISPLVVAGNPTCGDGALELKIERVKSGTYVSADGALTVTLDVNGETFSYICSGSLVSVIVKGGPYANVYASMPTNELTTPGGEAISHITFCYTALVP